MGSGKTQTSTQTFEPPQIVTDTYEDLVGRAQGLADTKYKPYGGDLFAGMNEQQRQALRALGNVGDVGSGYYDKAGTALSRYNAGLAGLDKLGAKDLKKEQQLLSQASRVAGNLDDAGKKYYQDAGRYLRKSGQSATDVLDDYLNPYLDEVVGSTLANINESDSLMQAQLAGDAIAKGAWGGDRAGIAAAELARKQALARNQEIADLRSRAYETSLGAAQTDLSRYGDIASAYGSLGNQQYQQKLGQTTALSGIADMFGNRASDAYGRGLSTAQGYGALADQYGTLGTNEFSKALQAALSSLQAGTFRQSNDQAALDSKYQQWVDKQQDPYKKLGFYGNIAGVRASDLGGTTTTETPAPSPFSQIFGGITSLASFLPFGGGGGGTAAQGGRIEGREGYLDGGAVGGFGEIAPWLIDNLQKDFSLTPEQAAGFVGNLAHESGGFNTLQEVKPIVPGSKGGFGYAQWTGPRRRAFEAWTKEQGLDPTSPEANYGFLKHELTATPEKAVLGSLRGANTAEEAAKIVQDKFLRPGIPHTSSRMDWTKKAMDYALGGAEAAGDAPTAARIAEIKGMAMGEEKARSAVENAVMSFGERGPPIPGLGGGATGGFGGAPTGENPLASSNGSPSTGFGIDFENEPWRLALLMAGLSMMSSNDPNAVGGIGAGATQGLNAYLQLMAQKKKKASEEAEAAEARRQWQAEYDLKSADSKREADKLEADKAENDRRYQLDVDKFGADVANQMRTGTMKEYDQYKKEAIAAGKPVLDRLEYDQALKSAGAPKITNDMRSEGAFEKKGAEKQAERFDKIAAGGAEASQLQGDINALRDIGANIQTGKLTEWKAALGPYAEALGVSIEGLGGMQAYNAVVARIAPRMRVEDSGATSDFEMQKFLESLPGLGKTSEGNAVISNTLEAVVSYKKRAAEIASMALSGELSRSEAEKQLRELPDPLTLWKKYNQKDLTGKDIPAEASPTVATKPLPEGVTPEIMIDQAKKAISAGKDPEAIRARAREYGVEIP